MNPDTAFGGNDGLHRDLVKLSSGEGHRKALLQACLSSVAFHPLPAIWEPHTSSLTAA